jgi:hypothetical protein
LNGKIIETSAVKSSWDSDYNPEDEDDESHARPSSSLVSSYFKMTGNRIDDDRKDKMRDIILSKDLGLIGSYRKEIQEYCSDDTKKCLELWGKLWAELSKARRYKLEHALCRGEYKAFSSLMETKGYPVDVQALTKFISKVDDAKFSLQEEINSFFPETPFFMRKFMPRKKEWKPYSMNQANVCDAIFKKYPNLKDSWPKTDKGSPSLSSKTIDKMLHFRHNYPSDDPAAQLVRYKRFLSSCSGFTKNEKNKGRPEFLDYLGSDGRARPDMNAFGSSTSRSQPRAKSFIFAKAAWMRTLVQPKKGSVIIGGDYSSQEVLIQACLSGDTNLFNSYSSGDVYLSFAKLAGAVPKDGTKSQYKKERDLFKSTFLGLGFGMGPSKLALKLTQDTGVAKTVEDALQLKNSFVASYSIYDGWRNLKSSEYKRSKMLQLEDGWILWGDEKSMNSVKNFPVQGNASAIMRRAVKYCYQKGLPIIFTLHDALYIEVPFDNWAKKALIFSDCLRRAFVDVLTEKGNNNKSWASEIRVDLKAWGPDLSEGKEFGISTSPMFIDERSVKDYEFFKGFLTA